MIRSRAQLSAARSIVGVARSLREAGLARTGGNVSALIRPGEFLITPTGYAVDRLGRIRARDLIQVAVDRPCPPRASVEAPVHAAVYAQLDGIGGVCHAHPPASLALGDPADWPRATESSRKLGPVHVATSQSGADLAREVRELLRAPGGAVTGHYGFSLMVPGHGLFTAARSVERALYLLFRIEENASVVLLGRRLAG